MKVLITGGVGYIGSELCRALNDDNDVKEVVLYDNLSSSNHNLFKFGKLKSNKFKFVNADLLDSRKLRQELKGVDIVYHLAAKVGSLHENMDSHFFEQVNHWGTAELCYAIEESDVKRVVYLSSTGVYGGGKDFMDEETVPNPRTYYGISKMRAEEHIRRLGSKIDSIIIRCANVYGFSYSMKTNGVINKFMFDANFSNRISIHGKGDQNRPFIHISKVVEVLNNALKADIPSDTYNLVGVNVSVLDLLDVLKELYPELEFIFINQHLKLRDVKVSDPEKLKKYISITDTNLREDLIDFKNSFAF